MAATLVIAISSTLGILISLYFVAIYRGWTKGVNALVPKNVCSKNTCSAVLQTPFAHVFRVPNFYLGVVYYLVLSLMTVVAVPAWVWWSALAVSLFAVAFSLYLAYALVFRLKTNCVLCFATHIMNLVIAITVAFIVSR